VNVDVLTWSVSLAVVAAIVLPYVLAFRRRRQKART